MRYTCEIEGFEECWIEFSPRWTRGELKRFWDASGEEWLDLLRGKITGLRLALVDAEPVTDPAGLTEEALDGMDNMLFQWFQNVPVAAILEVQRLGNEAGRRVLLKAGESAAQTSNSPTPTSTDG